MLIAGMGGTSNSGWAQTFDSYGEWGEISYSAWFQCSMGCPLTSIYISSLPSGNGFWREYFTSGSARLNISSLTTSYKCEVVSAVFAETEEETQAILKARAAAYLKDVIQGKSSFTSSYTLSGSGGSLPINPTLFNWAVPAFPIAQNFFDVSLDTSTWQVSYKLKAGHMNLSPNTIYQFWVLDANGRIDTANPFYDQFQDHVVHTGHESTTGKQSTIRFSYSRHAEMNGAFFGGTCYQGIALCDVHGNYTFEWYKIAESATYVDFSAEPPTETCTYTGTVHGNGSMTYEGIYTIPKGLSLDIRFTPDAGNYCSDVILNGESLGPLASVTISNIQNNIVLDSYFEEAETCTYTGTVHGGGSMTLEGEHAIPIGSSLEIEFTPDDGYYCSNVIMNEESLGPLESITISNIQEDITLDSYFEEIEVEYDIRDYKGIYPAPLPDTFTGFKGIRHYDN